MRKMSEPKPEPKPVSSFGMLLAFSAPAFIYKLGAFLADKNNFLFTLFCLAIFVVLLIILGASWGGTDPLSTNRE